MKNLLRGIIVIFGLLLIWQLIIIIFHFPDFILPSPLAVFHIGKLRADLIFSETKITVIETLLGFLLGILFGSIAAITMTFFRSTAIWFLPILLISQALPTFAIAPMLVIWFGYGMTSKIATTVLMLFFPITSAFYDGLRRTEQGWLDLAKTMNASRFRVFLHIRIPAALPNLASGIKVAAAIAPIGAVIGEWVGASKGLGFLMLNSNARMQIDLMFAALLVLIVFSLLLYLAVNQLLKTVIFWEKI